MCGVGDDEDEDRADNGFIRQADESPCGSGDPALTARSEIKPRRHPYLQSIRYRGAHYNQASARFARRCTAPCQTQQRIQSSSTLTAMPTASGAQRRI
mgnify:CR=1 FL=1